MKTPRTEAHPLETVALAAFRDSPTHDAASIAARLGGSSPAFVEVASEVLKHLVKRRCLAADPVNPGRFRMVEKGFSLAQEAWIRRGCRACMKDLPVKLADGRIGVVHSSRWNERSELEITIKPDGLWISATEARIIGAWKAGCCRPLKSRLNKILAEQAAG